MPTRIIASPSSSVPASEVGRAPASKPGLMRPVRGMKIGVAWRLFVCAVRRWSSLAGRNSCLRRENVESALEVVGGGGEMHLGGGFGEASPSHSTQTVAPFPGAEDLLDPGAHATNRCIPGVQAGQRIPLVAAPHRRQDDAWRAALGPNRIPEMRPAIGAV